MQRGDEKSACDAHGFLYIVVFNLSLVRLVLIVDTVVHAENYNQTRGNLQKLFMPISTQCFQCVEPLLRKPPLVIVPFLSFGGDTDLALFLRVQHNYKTP